MKHKEKSAPPSNGRSRGCDHVGTCCFLFCGMLLGHGHRKRRKARQPLVCFFLFLLRFCCFGLFGDMFALCAGELWWIPKQWFQMRTQERTERAHHTFPKMATRCSRAPESSQFVGVVFGGNTSQCRFPAHVCVCVCVCACVLGAVICARVRGGIVCVVLLLLLLLLLLLFLCCAREFERELLRGIVQFAGQSPKVMHTVR